jgi:hypothetical protein
VPNDHAPFSKSCLPFRCFNPPSINEFAAITVFTVTQRSSYSLVIGIGRYCAYLTEPLRMAEVRVFFDRRAANSLPLS